MERSMASQSASGLPLVAHQSCIPRSVRQRASASLAAVPVVRERGGSVPRRLPRPTSVRSSNTSRLRNLLTLPTSKICSRDQSTRAPYKCPLASTCNALADSLKPLAAYRSLRKHASATPQVLLSVLVGFVMTTQATDMSGSLSDHATEPRQCVTACIMLLPVQTRVSIDRGCAHPQILLPPIRDVFETRCIRGTYGSSASSSAHGLYDQSL